MEIVDDFLKLWEKGGKISKAQLYYEMELITAKPRSCSYKQEEEILETKVIVDNLTLNLQVVKSLLNKIDEDIRFLIITPYLNQRK